MFGENVLWDSTDQQLGKKVSSMAVLEKQKAGGGGGILISEGIK